jgi:hypothetical protein
MNYVSHNEVLNQKRTLDNETYLIRCHVCCGLIKPLEVRLIAYQLMQELDIFTTS